MYPTWYYSFPTVLSGEKRKIMIKFSMFFHQPIEVNICTNSNKDWNSNSKIYHCRQKQQNKQTDTKVNNLRHKMPSKMSKKITLGKSSTPQINSSQDGFKNWKSMQNTEGGFKQDTTHLRPFLISSRGPVSYME